MNLQFTSEETAFRTEVRHFLDTQLPEPIRRKGRLGQRLSREDFVQWQRILYQRGWATPAWPVEWGGTGWSVVQHTIFKEELYLAMAPEPLPYNVNMVGPVLVAFGSEEQKRHFLPRIARLDDWFCQGFSEPGAGSDLSSLRTRAVRDGDDYVVNGQKIWTSSAHHATWCFCLVRTDPHARQQEGISYLLIDMRTPGITVKPIITIDGHHETNEVFFDNVRVPAANRVGEENRGWTYAKFLLGHERSGIARVGICKARLLRARELAATIPVGDGTLLDDAAFLLRLTSLEIEVKALEMTLMRVVDAATRHVRGDRPDPMVSILKLKGSEMQQATTELLMDVASYQGLEADPAFLRAAHDAEGDPEAHWYLTAMPNYCWNRAQSIFSGSNEIQRNIVAKAVLGLRS